MRGPGLQFGKHAKAILHFDIFKSNGIYILFDPYSTKVSFPTIPMSAAPFPT